MSVQTLKRPTATHTLRRASTTTTKLSTKSARQTTRKLYTKELQEAGLRYFTNARGEEREFVVLAFVFKLGAEPSRVVLDRSRRNPSDIRLVAYLYPEEPAENAVQMCGDYLGWPRPAKRLARQSNELIWLALENELEEPEPYIPDMGEYGGQVAADGVRYCLMQVRYRTLIPEVRWYRCPPLGQSGPGQIAHLRDVVAAFESYWPFKEASAAAIKQYDKDPRVSIIALRGEWRSLENSRIVLNCGLRAKVQEAYSRGISGSEIAQRCGRTKMDKDGHLSGETSWLARRIGLLPEGGKAKPVVWVHSEVLQLIAWRGLGIAPREAEAA